MGSVNPDDIASISVLKDASSAAVYGARGAFGVILITTKDPEKGKVRVSYNGSVSLHRRTVIWEDNVVTDPVQWVEAFRESYLNSSPTATVPSLFNNYMPYSNAWFEELKRRRADPTMDNYEHRRQRQLQLLRRDELAQGDLQVGELFDHPRRQHPGRPRGRQLLHFGPLLQSGRHLQGGRGDLQEV